MFDTPEMKTRREQDAQRMKVEAYQKFLEKPETKLMLSFVPETQPPEVVSTLLKTAFDAGHDSGSGAVLIQVVEAMLKGSNRDGDRL